jgi:hypothetical protein
MYMYIFEFANKKMLAFLGLISNMLIVMILSMIWMVLLSSLFTQLKMVLATPRTQIGQYF